MPRYVALVRLVPVLAAVCVGVALVALAPSAQAAPAWVYRDLVLPRGDIALDLPVRMI